MDRAHPDERASAAHMRILLEKAEDALEQSRSAREMADRASRILRNADFARDADPI